MKTLQQAEIIEEFIRTKIEAAGLIKLPRTNEWLMNEINTLLTSYPILRKLNYKIMTLEVLQSMIQKLSNELDFLFEEQDELIFIDFTSQVKPISHTKALAELIIFVLLAVSKDKSHIHFKLNEKLMTQIKVTANNNYLFDNSLITCVSSKAEFHFLTSITSIVAFDFFNQDPIVKQIIAMKNKRYQDKSLISFLNHIGLGLNIKKNPNLKKHSESIKIKI